MRFAIAAVVLGSTMLVASGCGSSDPKVTMVDLDKVLEVFEATLNEKTAAPAKKADDKQPPAGGQAGIQPVANDQAKTAAFLKKFATNLNAKKMIEEPIGVQMAADGTIIGFVDKNKDMKKLGADEKELFKIFLDAKNNRVVASQTVENQTYNRDRRYRYRPGGFFMGYMLGNMMSRRSSYGARAAAIPRTMSPRGYYSSARSSAISRARTRVSRSSGGARRGGSRGFRGGK